MAKTKSNEAKALERATELFNSCSDKVTYLRLEIACAKQEMERALRRVQDAQYAYDIATYEPCVLITTIRHSLDAKRENAVVVHKTKSGKTIKVKIPGEPDSDAITFRLRKEMYSTNESWCQFPESRGYTWHRVELAE
jgi:hypothetical protein